MTQTEYNHLITAQLNAINEIVKNYPDLPDVAMQQVHKIANMRSTNYVQSDEIIKYLVISDD